MKAFVINVVGDIGLVLAAFFIFRELGTFDYLASFDAARESFSTNQGVVIAICLLLCVGAFAKSAQVPFHTWLPDAMEGPTPVSALIHAATMVTAGVYLIARMFPFFELAPTAADIAAFVGLATLLIAATIALAVTDLKRIIAYSTMSQIGYMIMGVAIGAYAGGMFMLMAHAFFKALLFMAAGSVISAMANNQNIDDMSGFRRALPFTSALLLVGCLALAAFPITSGFFAKDEILGYAADRGGIYWICAIGGYVGALMTAFYSFRIGFRVTAGPPCEEAKELEGGHMYHAPPTNPHTGESEDTDVGFPGEQHHIAEREWPMKVAMTLLGVGALFGGLIQIPGVDDLVTKFLDGTFYSSSLYSIVPSTEDSWIGLAVGGTISILGIGLAYLCYVRRPGVTVRLAERFRRTHQFLFNKWYFDELIDALVYRPTIAIGRFSNSVFERVVVQGIVGGTTGVVKGAGSVVRGAQSGFVRAYALLLVGGFAALGIYFLVVSN
jgi:NADH-quinone oxidoreductase subunit L